MRPVSVTIGQVFTLELFGVAVDFTATVATAANVVAGLLAAIAASSDAEWDLVDSSLNADGDALLITYSVTAGDLKIWRGDAPPIAQVTTVTPANVEIGDVYSLTMNGKSVTVTATAATATNVVSLFLTAIPAANLPEFNELTATNGGSSLILTANTAGVPFTVTGLASNGSSLGVTVETVQNGRAAVAGSNMIQTFAIPVSAAGTFRIVLGGGMTSAIAVGASAGTVQTAITGLSAVGSGNCTVSKATDSNDDVYTCTFVGALAGLTVATMMVTLTTSKPVIRTIQQGTFAPPNNEKQTLTFADGWDFDGAATGITYTLSLDAVTSSTIDSNTTPAGVAAILQSMANIGFGNLSLTAAANVLTVEFIGGSSSHNASQLVASNFTSGTTHSISIVVTSEQLTPPVTALNEQQRITLTGSPTGGTFTVTAGANTTAAIAFNASAGTVQTALQAIASIGASNCTVTGSAGGPWLVEFVAALAATDIAAMTGNGASLTGGASQSLTVATTIASEGPNHWDDPQNWLPVGVPVQLDRVRFEFGASDCLYGIEQNDLWLTQIEISSSYTGSIGLSRLNANGYVEYRPRDLSLNCSSFLIGNGNGAGSGKIQLNTLETTAWLEVRNTGGSRESGVPALTWYGNNAGSEIILIQGDLGVAIWSDQAATLNKVQQYGGSLRLDHSTLNALYCPGQDITAHETTLGGKPLEL